MDYSAPPPTTIAASSKSIYDLIKSAPRSVLCGRNNSGKSFLLRKLLQDIGETASYLGPARYYNFNVLAAFNPRSNRKQEKWQKQQSVFQDRKQNIDNSPLDLAQAIAELSNSTRDRLFEMVDRLLKSTTNIQYTVPDNSMSQKYVSVDGHNLAFTSSGFRLVTTLLTSLLDTDYERFLIDEPELGLSPEIQGRFADFIFDDGIREAYFPHIKTIVLATHSPIFLERRTFTNNYSIERSGAEIIIRQLSTVQDLNSLQFYLLGNRFENLYLPSAIIFVEGLCDFEYINRLVAIHLPDSHMSVIHCGGDSRIRNVVHVARKMLSDIRRSPYADRIFVVLDSVHERDLVEQLEGMGIARDNVIVWEANGIEHVYPQEILEAKFGSFNRLEIVEDRVSANGMNVTKKELSDFVVGRLSPQHALPPELKIKLVSKLEAIAY